MMAVSVYVRLAVGVETSQVSPGLPQGSAAKPASFQHTLAPRGFVAP